MSAADEYGFELKAREKKAKKVSCKDPGMLSFVIAITLKRLSFLLNQLAGNHGTVITGQIVSNMVYREA